MSYTSLSASLPPVRNGAAYVQSYRDLMDASKAASKTDNDTDYREDFVKTKIDDTTVTAQLSAKEVKQSSTEGPGDFMRTDSTSIKAIGNTLVAQETSVVKVYTYDPEFPWSTEEGVSRTVVVELASGEIVHQQKVVFDPEKSAWNLAG